MHAFALTRGLVVRRGDRTWSLQRHLPDNTLVFEDQLTGRPLTLTVSQLWTELQARRLHIVTGEPPGQPEAGSAVVVFDWSTLPDHVRRQTERRLEYVRRVSKEGITRGSRADIQQAIVRIAAAIVDPAPPSASSVMAWMRRLDQAGRAPSALVSRAFRRRSQARLAFAVLDAARRVLADFYCSASRPSLVDVLTRVRSELALLVRRQELTAKQADISLSTLRRLKDRIDPYQRDVARYGAAYARNRWRYSLKGVSAPRAMARYEIDHTLLDVVAVCDVSGLPLGRPTITVVVDAFSGYVVGFFVSFWGTGLSSTFAALKVALAPKPDLSELGVVQHVWLGMGSPELLAMDNGLEFHSPQLRRLALQLDVDLEYCAVRQPWLKPVVERSLGSLIRYLPASGRIRRAQANELALDPDSTAAVTFSDLCTGLLKVFVDVLPFERNERKLNRPWDLFSESLASLPPPNLIADVNGLDVIVAPSDRLTVGNEGIVRHYLRYNSAELQAMRRVTAHSFKTEVKYDPENLHHVWVQDPRNHQWLCVPSCQPEYTAGLSFVQHRAIRAHARETLERRNAEAVLMRAKEELAALWSQRVARGKRLKASHLRALQGLTSSHLLRGPAATQSAGKPPSVPVLTGADLRPEEHPIPVFEAFEF
jgi:putative transposase